MDRESLVQQYFARLESNPHDLLAVWQLEQLFPLEERGQLVGAMKDAAPDQPTPEGSARLYLEAGRIAGLQLGKAELGQALLARATQMAEDNALMPEVKLATLSLAGEWEEAFDFFGQAVEQIEDAGVSSRLYLRMGNILEDVIEDLGEADNAYNYAAELDPGNILALRYRQELARSQGEWLRLAEVLYAEASVGDDAARQMEVMLDLGDVYLRHLEREEDAAQCYVSVYEFDPANERARAALAELGYDVPALEEDGEDVEVEAADPEEELEVAPIEEDEELEVAPIEDEELEVELAEESDADELDGAELEQESDADELDVAELEEESDAESAEDADEDSDEGAEDSEAELEADELEDADLEEGDEDEVEELEAVEEIVAEEEDDEDPDAAWRNRFMSLMEQASGESGEAALQLLVRAARLEARHRDGDALALRLWREAVAQDLASDFHSRAHFLFDSASFWESALEETDEAKLQAKVAFINLGDADRASSLAGDDEEIAQLLEDREAGDKNWRKFQRELEGRFDDLGEDEKAFAVYWRMADLSMAAGDVDKEMDALRRLDRQVDSDGRVKSRLKRVYAKAEKWPMYVDIIKKEVEGLGDDDPAEKIDLLNEMVVVYRDEMQHDMMVVNTYKDILALDESNLEAIDALIGLYDKLNRSSELVAMLQQKAEMVKKPARKVEIYSQIAQLFLEKFRNQAEAIKAYESVLEIDAYHPEALSFLKEMYEKRRDWEKLIDVHKREIETYDSDEAKAEGLKEVAQLASDRLRNNEIATELWLEVRQFATQDPDALDALETLYEKTKSYDELGEILDQKAAINEDAEEQMKLYQKMGMLYSDRLGNAEKAISAWQKALALQPDDLKARKALERLYIDNQLWDDLESFYDESDSYEPSDLVRLLETLAGTVKEDDVKIELLLRAARNWRERLDDTGRAERDLERVLGIDERNAAAALQLEPIYVDAEQYDKLKDVYEIILEHREETEERREYQLKLAELHEAQLGDVGNAFAWYAQAFLSTPETDDLVELERTANQSDQWAQLVSVYQTALGQEISEDSHRRLRLRLGRVLSEELGQLDEALAQFQSVLDEDDENLKALAAIEDIYERAERWDDLMKVYQRRIELTDAPEDRVKILHGMAMIAENQTGDVDSAITKYKEALEIDENYAPSLAALHRLYAGRQDYDDLADVIRREIAIVEANAEARTEGAVSIVDAMGLVQAAAEPEVAEPEFVEESEAELEIEPVEESEPGFDEDDGLAEESSESGLEEVSSESDLEEDSSDAGLDEDSSDAEEAEEEEGLDEESLEEESEEEFEEESEEEVVVDAPADEAARVAVAEGPIYTEEDVELLVSLRYELGIVCKEFLGEDEEAVTNLGRVLAWRPNHADALAAIESYLESTEFQHRVAVTLEPVYEVRGAWDDLIRVLGLQVDHASDDAEKVRLLGRMGDIHLDEKGEPEAAFRAYSRILPHQPSHGRARGQMERIAAHLGNWQEVVEHYSDALGSVDDVELEKEYYFALGDIWADHLDDAAQAQEWFEKVLEKEPSSARALDELEGLLLREEKWEELHSVLEKKLALADSEEEVRARRLRIALLFEEKLGDRGKAIEIYGDILADHPEDLGALRAMNRLYRTEGRWDELAANLENELELAPAEETNDVKNRLAGVLHAHLGEWERAVDLYEEVLDSDAADADALGSMEELMYAEDAPSGRISRILEPLYMAVDNWASLVAALEVQAETAETDEERVELLHRIAALHETRGQSFADAFQTYARALQADVENEATLQHLYRLAQTTNDYEYLVQVFEFTASESEEPLVKRDMLRRAATVLRDTIVDVERATERLHQVLEHVPEDIETVNELQAIYERDSNWGQLVSILVQKAELVEEPEQKIQLLKQSATMYEEFLEAPLQAIDSYNRVLTIDDSDAHAIDRLEVLYREQEMWDELLSTFQRKVELAPNDEARKDLFYAMGMIYREELHEPHDAIDTFRNILEIDTAELSAWQHLDELFQETEQWSELLQTLEAQLSLTQVPEDWYTLKYRIGRLYETELFDVPQSIEVYREILENDGTHQPTTEALEGLIERGDHEAQAAEVLVPIYQQGAEWEKLIHINRLLIEATEDPERRLELFNEVGQIQEHRVGDLAAAFETFVEAFGADPTREETLNTLERLAAQLDAWELLIERLDEKLADMTDFAAVRAVLLRIARIYEQETLDASSAIDRFNRVLEIEPDDSVAIEALDRLYQREGRWEDLAEILRARILNCQDPDEMLSLRLRLGQLFQTALEDAQSALETYQEILLNDPENPQAIQSLEQMFMSGQAVTQVAAILEPFYSERGQHEKLVEIYVQRLEQIDEPEERYDVWMLIANTFLQELQDKESAIVAYGRALAEKPEEVRLIEEIEEIAGETGAWGQAAELFADALEAGRADEEAQVPLYLALARIFDKQLGLMDEAEQSYLAALQLDETQPDALEALDRIYENQARWSDLASVIERRIEGLYDEEKIVDLKYRLAQLFQTQLMDLDQAVDTYRSILDVTPIHAPSLKMLERIFYERQEWEDLFEILERESEITEDPDERANFYGQMAQLAEEALDRKMEAVDLWNRVLQMREDDLNALRQLRRLYVEDERWSDLVNVLEREVELTEDAGERLGLYQALGQLWGDQLANEGQALDSWQKVLEIDPNHLPALRALRQLYENQSDYVELSNVIYRLLDHEGVEPDSKLELWTQQGRIQGEMLMQPERAIEAWKHVLTFDPGNEMALEQLEQQFLQESRWEEAAEVLEMKLDFVEDAFDKIDLLVRIADIWETKIMDRDRAAQFYEYILEVDPTNTQAGASLEAIYREQATPDAYQKLASLYLDRSDQMADDIASFLEARRQSANIFEVELQHPDGAFLVLLTAFTPDTLDDQQLIADLERLARETGSWAELVAAFEGVLQQIGDALEAAELHKMVGKWQAEELELPDDAVYHLQRALSIEPDNVDVMDNLERLYREIAAWPELSQILHQRVELTMDPDEQSDLWRKLGELYEMQMGQVDDAISAYKHILQIDPSDILAIESLERIYEAYDRWTDLVSILRQKAESTYDPDEIVGIRFRIAQIQEERLESVEEAIATYREILAVDQTHMQSLKELERLFMATSDWHSLTEVYEQQIQLTHEPEEQIVIYGRQAALFENQFEDVDSAVESYNNILMVDPESLDAIQNLERLYSGSERWFDLVEVMQRHTEVTALDDGTRSQILSELGRIQRDQVNDPNAAIEAFNRSLQINPDQPQLLEELANLYDETANWDAAVEALRQKASATQDQADKIATFGRIGFMYEANLQNDVAAEEAYQSALAIDPGHEPTLLAMRDLYQRRGDWGEVIRTLKLAEESSRDLSRKAEFLCEIGKVYDQQMDDTVSAVRYYETALENDPNVTAAAEPLIDLYVVEQKWERAQTLLERVLASPEERSPEEMHKRFFQKARVHRELGLQQEALAAFQEAYELDPTHTDTLKGLSALLYNTEQWEAAFKIFQALQFNHTDTLSTEEIVDLYFRSGRVKDHTGEPMKAVQMYQKALEYDPRHPESLAALIKTFEGQGRWDQVIEYTRYLLDAETEPTARFAYFDRIGDIYAQQLNQPMAATEAYLEALDIDPKSVIVLRKLLNVYTQEKQWPNAVEMLKRLIENETDDGRRAKYAYTIAVIHRDEMNDALASVEWFDQALDADVKQLKPFEAIDRILTEAKSWKELERAYRRMLRRVAENDDGEMESIKILLWQNLGEIYRSRLGHMKSAIQAFETAVGLKPDSQKNRLILAELYERSGDHPDGAIEQHKELIKIDHFRIESYRALWKAYMQKKEYDKAWCMAGALSFLQNANDQEEKFYKQYLGQNLKLAKGQFNQEMMKLIYHEDQDPLMSAINSYIGQGLRQFYARNIKEWGVHKKKDILSPDEQLMFCKIYSYAARTSGLMPAPTLYLRRDQALGMRNANTDPPAFIVGGDMMQGKGDRELAFIIGKQVCLARPENYLASLGFPTEFLKLFFMATMHVTDQSLGIGPSLGEQGAPVIKEIMSIPAQMLMQMQKMMKAYLQKGENPNLSEWLTGVDHTGSRMGLIMCGDLHQAASCIKNDTNPVGKATAKEKIRELVLFSISDEYFKLRQQLGLSIDNR